MPAPADPAWVDKIETFSRLCEEGDIRTHIAFLGTSILAKSCERRVDLFAIKPKHAPDNERAYSARSLCHGVLVPLAAELGINLGATGREPLNNQPYFRISRLGDETPVHAGGRAAFDFMVELVQELQEFRTEAAALPALHAFVAVRRGYQPRYLERDGAASITPGRLATAIRTFVRERSEGGERAQAVVAGLLDVFAGVARVESGRINDPSRRYPGDVCVRAAGDATVWEKAFEVRDKPVSLSDVHIFGKKCVDMGVREAAVVMVADRQPAIESEDLWAWAGGFGIGLTLFHGWDSIVEQALFWSPMPKPDSASRAVGLIHDRLLAVEASTAAVALWDELTRD